MDAFAQVEADRRALTAAAPLEYEPTAPRSLVVDRFGDVWERGLTRWTCTTPVDGHRIEQVARLPWSALAGGPDGAGVYGYGPVKLLRHGDGPFLYETVRPRTPPTPTAPTLW